MFSSQSSHLDLQSQEHIEKLKLHWEDFSSDSSTAGIAWKEPESSIIGKS